MLQVVAWTCGRRRVEKVDCLLLLHVLWRSAEEREPLRKWLREFVLGSRGRQVAAVMDGLKERLRSSVGTALMPPADELRRELAAFRSVLLSDVREARRRKQLLSVHTWLAPQEAQEACAEIDAKLAAPREGSEALLADVGRIEAAVDLARLDEYLQLPSMAHGSFTEAGSPASSAASEDETFTVGKYRGKQFSDVATSDVDYCRMVRRKVAQGQFAEDSPLHRQMRVFVAYLEKDSTL